LNIHDDKYDQFQKLIPHYNDIKSTSKSFETLPLKRQDREILLISAPPPLTAYNGKQKLVDNKWFDGFQDPR
jgi:hypothetical protein